MAAPDVVWKGGRFGNTSRRDAWWVSPAAVFLGFGAFHRVRHVGGISERSLHLRQLHFAVLFAGDLRRFAACAVRAEAALVSELSAVFSGVLILWIPGGFRLTCYYYRGAYYKAFWADPPACAVSEPRKTYLGERSFPADPAEFPSLLSAALLPGLGFPGVRRGEVVRFSRMALESGSAASFWW